MTQSHFFLGSAALLTMIRLTAGTTINGADYNSPSAGPSTEWFQAATTIPVAAIQTAAAQASIVPSPTGESTYPVSYDSGAAKSTIYGDWIDFESGTAYVFVADMDVDCDGIDYECEGNQDGQDETDYGALAAYEVPWIVIPGNFVDAHSADIAGNNVVAVICDGKMFYGIFGDSNGGTPEVIGEASWLMARTCFPNDNLNGNSGHTGKDVTYIVFTGDDAVLQSPALTTNYIDNFGTLKTMGDKFVTALAQQLGLSV